MWAGLVLFYGIVKGARDIIKKKALEKNSVMEVLLVYTLLGLLMLVPDIKNVGGLDGRYYVFIFIKAFVIFLAWTFSFISIKKLPVSLYGVLDLSRVLFSTSLGVLVLGEVMGPNNVLGLILVCAGLLMLGRRKQSITTSTGEEIPVKFFVLAFASCMLNSVSALLDKMLLKDAVTSSQLQFWYMLFLVLLYLGYILITRTRIDKSVFKNIYVWALAILFIAADKALFIANSDPGSQIIVMTLIKQSACLVMIIGGKLVFKERDILYKLLCSAVVIAGIVISVIR